MDNILGVCGGNGVILSPFNHKNLLGNVEPRAAFFTPGDVQWNLNFKCPIDRDLGRDWKKVDVIVGAPNCGHSSVLAYSRGKKLKNPKGDESLAMYVQALRNYIPKIFLLENLIKMLDNYPRLLKFLEKKYQLVKFVQPVSFWGNPQVTRKRLVLIGIRKDLDVTGIKSVIDEVTRDFNNVYLKTSEELIKGLENQDEDLCNVREPHDYYIPLYYRGKRRITTLEAKRIWNGEFKGKSRWEVDMARMKCQPGVYLNKAGDYPKTARKQNRQFNHFGEMLTPRELARIQGVPDNFKLWYTPDKSLYCINKARTTVTKTPPYEIANWFCKIINEL